MDEAPCSSVVISTTSERFTPRRSTPSSQAILPTPGFSITTNGTLVTEADADFFEEHGFAVTVSLDGYRALAAAAWASIMPSTRSVVPSLR